MSINFFIGYDPKEDIAYRICKYSLLKRASTTVKVFSLKLDELIAKKLYTRTVDPLASTQFTYSRFLVPKLMNYTGWAVFCDCDFIFLDDVNNLIKNLDDSKAVYCVQHDYTPKEKHKMDGQKQTIYPRKNWSSFILFNCSHPSTKNLTVETVNSENGAYLHQFKWCKNEEIGKLDERWNWLEGWTSNHNHNKPFAVHYTRGGPWFSEWQDVEYAKEWINERDEYLSKKFNYQN
jgi:lipopolysaccharide biosynthesis glycosyltransferase|tara:strand:+ start:278 stop:979 length:702 start_codon:yes stop_codon:yes gene_type:complete